MFCSAPLAVSWLLCAAPLAPAAPLDQDQVQVQDQKGGLVTMREQLHFDLKQGERAVKNLRLRNAGTEALTVAQVWADHACVQIRRKVEKEYVDVSADQSLGLVLEPEEFLRLSISLDSAGLELGDHQFHFFARTQEAEGPECDVLLTMRLRDNREDDERDFDASKPPVIETTGGPPPKLVFDHYTWDAGDRWIGERLLHTFTFENQGEGPLIVQDFRTQCHCSVARLELNGIEIPTRRRRTERLGILQPGEKGSLDVEVDTTGQSLDLNKKFSLFTNDLERNSSLTVTAILNSAFQIDEPSAPFGEIRRADRAVKRLTISSKQLGEFTIEGYSIPNKPILDVEYRLLPPGKAERTTYKIILRVRPDVPYGEHVGTVMLEIGHEKVKEARFTFQMKVLPEVDFLFNNRRLSVDAVRTDNINFGLVRAPTDERPAINNVKRILIENQNPDIPYIPRSVRIEARPSSDLFECEIIPLVEGLRYELLLKVKDSPNLSSFVGKLFIESDHPNLPEAAIRFTGIYSRR